MPYLQYARNILEVPRMKTEAAAPLATLCMPVDAAQERRGCAFPQQTLQLMQTEVAAATAERAAKDGGGLPSPAGCSHKSDSSVDRDGGGSA